MTTDTPRDGRPDACPDAELLAAYVDGAVTPAERTTIEMHLIECAECRDVVGGAVELAGSVAAPGVRRAGRAKWVAVAAGMLAAAAAVLIVVRPEPDMAGQLGRLLPGRDAARPVAARLSVMSDYARPPDVTRGAPSATEVAVDARIVATELERAALSRPSAERLHAAGVAKLLTSDPRGAVELLERAAAESPTAAILADLSAALLADAHARGDAGLTSRAADTAARALAIDSRYQPALFNAALAVEATASRADASRAWQRYLDVDGASLWAVEARTHLARIRDSERQ